MHGRRAVSGYPVTLTVVLPEAIFGIMSFVTMCACEIGLAPWWSLSLDVGLLMCRLYGKVTSSVLGLCIMVQVAALGMEANPSLKIHNRLSI